MEELVKLTLFYELRNQLPVSVQQLTEKRTFSGI